MTPIFGDYASGNTAPADAYAEGAHYPAAPPATTVTLTSAAPATAWKTYRVKHLASVNVLALPGSGLTAGSWRLRVQVEAPPRSAMPAVVVLVERRNHPATRTSVSLTPDGVGRLTVPFGASATRQVTVTLANASTRFRCHTGGGYSCDGTSMAPHPAYRLRLRAVAS
jgi:hypothetical protein